MHLFRLLESTNNYEAKQSPFIVLFSIALIYLTLVGCGGTQKPSLESPSGNNSSVKLNSGFMMHNGEIVPVLYEAHGDYALVGGDALVPREDIAQNSETLMNLVSEKGVKLWSGAVVPYRADPSIPKDVLARTVSEYARAGIKLTPKTDQGSFLDIKLTDCFKDPKTNKCNNRLHGKSGCIGHSHNNNENNVTLVRDLFTDPKRNTEAGKNYMTHLLIHEIGHSIGARHEQARPDAKDFYYPAVVEGEAWLPIEGMPGHFINRYYEGWVKTPSGEKRYWDDTKTHTEPDKNSVMLYCDQFIDISGDPNRAEEEKRKGNPICKPGQEPSTLSERDIEGFRAMYDAEIRKRPADATTCYKKELATCLANVGGHACYTKWHCPIPNVMDDLMLPSNCTLTPPERSNDSAKNLEYFDIYTAYGEYACGKAWGDYKPSVRITGFTLRGWDPKTITITKLNGVVSNCKDCRARGTCGIDMYSYKVSYTYSSVGMKPFLIFCQRERRTHTISSSHCHQEWVDYGRYLTKECPVSKPSFSYP